MQLVPSIPTLVFLILAGCSGSNDPASSATPSRQNGTGNRISLTEIIPADSSRECIDSPLADSDNKLISAISVRTEQKGIKLTVICQESSLSFRITLSNDGLTCGHVISQISNHPVCSWTGYLGSFEDFNRKITLISSGDTSPRKVDEYRRFFKVAGNDKQSYALSVGSSKQQSSEERPVTTRLFIKFFCWLSTLTMYFDVTPSQSSSALFPESVNEGELSNLCKPVQAARQRFVVGLNEAMTKQP